VKLDVRLANPLLKSRDDLFSRCVRLCAEAAVLSNRALIHEAKMRGSPLPRLFSGVVIYENEPENQVDELVDIPTLIKRGHGDCLHLSAWRVAELREDGEARARIVVSRQRKFLKPGASAPARIFHVLVRRGNGTKEDPSKILGM